MLFTRSLTQTFSVENCLYHSIPYCELNLEICFASVDNNCFSEWSHGNLPRELRTQPLFTSSVSTMETPGQNVKSVQS